MGRPASLARLIHLGLLSLGIGYSVAFVLVGPGGVCGVTVDQLIRQSGLHVGFYVFLAVTWLTIVLLIALAADRFIRWRARADGGRLGFSLVLGASAGLFSAGIAVAATLPAYGILESANLTPLDVCGSRPLFSVALVMMLTGAVLAPMLYFAAEVLGAVLSGRSAGKRDVEQRPQ